MATKSSKNKPVVCVVLKKGALSSAKKYIEMKGIDWDPDEEKPEKPLASTIESLAEANRYNRSWNGWANKVNGYAEKYDAYLKEREIARKALGCTGKKKRK